MKLSEIEAVATMTCGLFITGQKDVCLDWNDSEKAQEIIREEQDNMSIGETQGLHTAEQMQQFKNDAIKEIFEKYNIFDAEGRGIQLGDLLGGHEK